MTDILSWGLSLGWKLIIILVYFFFVSSVRADDGRIVRSGNYICHGGHERCNVAPGDYRYHQFGMNKIGDFAGFSDVLGSGSPMLQYHSFLSELKTYRADSNAVAFWSDGAARVDRARVWGGFISARSGLHKGEDAQLVGLEVDVLNGGLPGISPNSSKTGIQIVGFGNTNTNAIEILHQHSPDSGHFMNGINIQSGTIHKDGTVIGVAPQIARVGIDMSGSAFADSAILLSEDSPVRFRKSGTPDVKIYRDSLDKGHLVLTAGLSGLRVTNADSSLNLLSVSDDGWLRSDSLLLRNYTPWLVAVCALLALSLLANAIAFWQIFVIRRQLGGASN